MLINAICAICYKTTITANGIQSLCGKHKRRELRLPIYFSGNNAAHSLKFVTADVFRPRLMIASEKEKLTRQFTEFLLEFNIT